MESEARLSTWIWILAGLMRRMPIRMRRAWVWWERLYMRLGGGGYAEDPAIDQRWPAGLQKPIRGRAHGMLMRLDLQDWAERWAYFSGRYYQRPLGELLGRVLRPGDQFVDIGANIGMTSLIAAGRIGRGGVGLSYEPNPKAFQRLHDHLTLNELAHFQAIPAGLGRQAQTAVLSLDGRHTGTGTLTLSAAADTGQHTAVEIRSAQDVAGRLDSSRPTLVKIDVEGYEYEVLCGLKPVLDWPEVMVVVEITDQALRRLGQSGPEVYRLMEEHGYIAHRFKIEQRRWRWDLRVWPSTDRQDSAQHDALFARKSSRVYVERLRPLINLQAE
ncbi:MAG: FkbM family methyltransferase [Phycisphaeraceae bacterium]|nr:FkbM family methyltransferase [Phycisphaeraceae bacterium]